MQILVTAVQMGDQPMLEWLRAQSPPVPWHVNVCVGIAAKRGDISMLGWMRSQEPPVLGMSKSLQQQQEATSRLCSGSEPKIPPAHGMQAAPMQQPGMDSRILLRRVMQRCHVQTAVP